MLVCASDTMPRVCRAACAGEAQLYHRYSCASVYVGVYIHTDAACAGEAQLYHRYSSTI